MAGKSGKGSNFEREICKMLSEWWSSGANDDLFWRTDNSGGRAKFRKRYQGKDTYGQAGDVQAINPIGQPLLDVFTLELKRGYSKNTMMDMMDKKPHMAMQQWEKHIRQVIGDSKNAKSKSWMLISRRDQREAVIDITIGIANLLVNEGCKLFQIPHLKSYLILKNEKRISVYTTQLFNFLKVVNPDNVKAIIE